MGVDGSNFRPSACKADALPAELAPQKEVSKLPILLATPYSQAPPNYSGAPGGLLYLAWVYSSSSLIPSNTYQKLNIYHPQENLRFRILSY